MHLDQMVHVSHALVMVVNNLCYQPYWSGENRELSNFLLSETKTMLLPLQVQGPSRGLHRVCLYEDCGVV